MLNETEINVTLHCPWLDGYRSRHSALIQRWKMSGFFQDDHLQDINCYWFQFEPVSLLNHFGLVCIFVIIMLAGCLGNFITIYILASSRHLRTPANIIIMNLAVSDFFMLAKMPIFLYNSFLQGPALGSRGCEVYGFLGGLTGTTSIMSLAAVAVDRYLVISHPLNSDKKLTRTRAFVIAALIWLYSAVFASLPLFGIGKYVPEGYLTSCSFDYLSDDEKTRIFILSFFVAAWLVPFLIISSCYAAIFWYVRKARIELERQQWSQQIESSVMRNCAAGLRHSKVELVIAKISMALVLLWLTSWTPYAFVALLGITGNRLTPGMTMLPALFAKLSACVNPIVYTLSHPKIRKEMCRRWYSFMSSRTPIAEIVRGTQEIQVASPGRDELNPSAIYASNYFKREQSLHQRISLVNLSDRCRTRQDNSRIKNTNETCLSISASVALAAYAHGTTSLYRYSPHQDEVNRSEPSTEQVTDNNSEVVQIKDNVVSYSVTTDTSNSSLRRYF